MSEQERNPREALEDDLTKDLELDKESSEDVRGGYSFGATQTGSFMKGQTAPRPETTIQRIAGDGSV